MAEVGPLWVIGPAVGAGMLLIFIIALICWHMKRNKGDPTQKAPRIQKWPAYQHQMNGGPLPGQFGKKSPLPPPPNQNVRQPQQPQYGYTSGPRPREADEVESTIFVTDENGGVSSDEMAKGMLHSNSWMLNLTKHYCTYDTSTGSILYQDDDDLVRPLPVGGPAVQHPTKTLPPDAQDEYKMFDGYYSFDHPRRKQNYKVHARDPTTGEVVYPKDEDYGYAENIYNFGNERPQS